MTARHRSAGLIMAIYGYASLSTDGQTLASQTHSCMLAGASRSILGEGDVLMHRLDRLANPTREMVGGSRLKDSSQIRKRY
jgi:hypothetical protein